MLDDKKTIFALATAPGKSGVAVIRISGNEAFKSLEYLTNKTAIKPRVAVLRELVDPNTKHTIDQAIVIYFPAPNSFTGEDIVELHIHGSRAIINILIKLLSEFNNFRLANPGEFAKRAFLNGKMDLTASEGLADLIEAETSMQQQQAIRQMQGDLGNAYEEWKNRLIRILALLEAYIDFPDEDIPDDVLVEVNNLISELKYKINNHLNDNHKGEIIRRGIYVTILGAPNVGKSSLLNYLAKRDVAIVSNIAGTTRDVLEVNLDLNGYPVTIVDTAGIRESEDVIEKEGIKRALMRAEDADIKILMFAADQPQNLDQTINKIIDDETIIILNKIDAIEHVSIKEDLLQISIEENIGLDKFLKLLLEKIEQKFSPATDPVITRQRHRVHLNKCLEALEYFSMEKDLELACEDIRIAARQLGHITGHINVETILDEIFRNFCIGK
jgi:tRNA modification GTPase